eukprot:106152-Chlamydomonas_euryale.AAC.1
MAARRWRVTLLSEMPPAGLVGVSPVCVLGYNMNRGQEIALRLRTDDLRGFRKYEAVRDTLVHELAHMVRLGGGAAGGGSIDGCAGKGVGTCTGGSIGSDGSGGSE